MNILLIFRQDIRRTPVQCYAHSYVNEFKALGHNVTVIGKGHQLEHIYQYDPVLLNSTNFILEIENGRDEDGKLPFQLDRFSTEPSIPTAVLLIDALETSTPILTTEGWKTLLEIKAGDKVFSERGGPIEVSSVSPVYFNKDCYKIYLDNGDTFIADAGHQWSVEDRGTYSYKTINRILATYELEDYKYKQHFRYHIPLSKPIEYKKDYNLEIRPYTLGYWLGNGNSYGARITTIDNEVVEEIRKEGYRITKIENTEVEYTIANGLYRGLNFYSLLKNKHIPDVYYTASIDDRFSLLQGLMDSDGECAKDGTAYFHNKNKHLIDQVYSLIVSLGLKASLKKYIKKSSGFAKGIDHEMYRIAFSGFIEKNQILFKVKRKLDRQKLNTKKSLSHKIIKIEKVSSVPVRCITVESPSKLFLVGRSLIPTHNSHGHPDLHQLVAKKYDHVFFAVWARRDLFKDHKSAHWCPNATDLKWFGYENFKHIPKKNDIVFIGSKKGLIRANSLQEICKKNGWIADIREVVKPRRHRWPVTGEAMAMAKIGYNRGQKHDGPNQRVMETMVGRLPLLNDLDHTDGMSKLFTHGKHFIGYDKNNSSDLEEKIFYILDNQTKAEEIALAGYNEVKEHHLVKNRVQQISEICKLGV